MATAQIIEAIEVTEDMLGVTSLALLAGPEHSGTYGSDPLIPGDDNTVWTYSYERWFQVQLTGGFAQVSAFRIWCPDLMVPDGWEMHFGITDTYATPVNTASAIATGSVPTSDPGAGSPNAGGSTPIAGPGPVYSNWVVLQARAQGGTRPGPILGFDLSGAAIPLNFEFHWTEVD